MSQYQVNLTSAQVLAFIQNGGAPAGVYADLAALTTAIPTGNTKIYVTLDDGKWNYWNGSAWAAGAAYTDSAATNAALALKADKSDTYTKAEVDNKVSAVYRFKGNVATYANLPTESLVVGDVYNVTDTGINYAWTGSVWDDIGGVEALATASNNGLMSKEDFSKLAGIAANANNYVHPATHSADIITDGTINKAYTATEKTKLAGIETGAQVNPTIVNDLTTGGATNALSAEQGKALKTAVDAKLPSASYTAVDVLAKVKTVDGTGSGLDADLLDGNEASYFTGLIRDCLPLTIPSQQILRNHYKTVTGYGLITMPNNASGGVEGILSGNTATNLVTNGNFASGTTEWSGDGATVSATSNTLSVIGTGAKTGVSAYRALMKNPVINNKYYVKYLARVTNAACVTLRVHVGGTVVVTKGSPTQNEWYPLSTVITATTTATNIQLYHYYADLVTANGKVMEVKEVFCKELDSTEQSLTAAQLDAKYPNWFDGTKSTEAVRVKSTDGVNTSYAYVPAVGKNNATDADSINLRTGIKTQRISAVDGSTLATSVITYPHIRGKLESYPNGTITTEPTLWGYMTASPTTITDSTKPIKSIRKVVRFDVVNGVTIETDVTANASTSDNLALAVSSFDTTKTYFYDCEYDAQYSTSPLVTANVEVIGGVVSKDYGAAATAWTLTANESKAKYFSLTNAGGSANMVMMPIDGDTKIIKNASGQTITVKTATSTGVTIATAKTATVLYTGTDYIKIAEV